MTSLVNSSKEGKGIWKGHFNCLMNEASLWNAIVFSIGIEAGGKLMSVQREVAEEVKKTILWLKCVETAGLDGLTLERLKYCRGAVVECDHT